MTLDEIALKCKTDKASDGHNYTQVYEHYLEQKRGEHLLIFELGVGGYNFPDRGGESLKMWREYLPIADIVGIDIYPKTLTLPVGVYFEQGSQADPDFLNAVIYRYGQPDLIVDDASHVNELTIKSFEILFPLLKPGGLYVVEDVHTSFWPVEYNGDPDPKGDKLTTLRFFQLLTPQLSQDSMNPKYHNEYTGYLDFIHFYRNLIIIKKK